MNSRFRFFVIAFLLSIAALPAMAKPAKGPKVRDVPDTIYANPILTSFAKLLQGSPDIYTFLSSRGPFTVFVPTDSAFAKLPPGEMDALLRPENHERLQHILLFHIIEGKRLAMKDLVPMRAMFSCEGNPLTFKLARTGVDLVMKAKILHADIHCANGNINEVDTVLMPAEGALPSMKFVPEATPAAAGPTPAVTPVPSTGGPSDGSNAVVVPTVPVASPH